MQSPKCLQNTIRIHPSSPKRKTPTRRPRPLQTVPKRNQLKMTKYIAFLVILRDGCQQIANAADTYLQSLAPYETIEQEQTFLALKFEAQRGAKLGNFEVAHKPTNSQDKWQTAYDILALNNATIDDRYHADNYQYSYWLYGSDRIYRQKQKPR
jgi:hypothetical protein